MVKANNIIMLARICRAIANWTAVKKKISSYEYERLTGTLGGMHEPGMSSGS